MTAEKLFALVVFFAACWAVVGWMDAAIKWAFKRWRERREARRPNRVFTISSGYRVGVDGRLHLDHLTMNPVHDDEISKCRKEAEAFGFSFDEHYAARNGLEDPEPPDDWERENQAAMIEAVKAKGSEK